MNGGSERREAPAKEERHARYEELRRRTQELQEQFERGAARQERWQALNRWLMSHASEGVAVLAAGRLVSANRRFYAFCAPPAEWRCLSDPGIEPGPLLDLTLGVGREAVSAQDGQDAEREPRRLLLAAAYPEERFLELYVEVIPEEPDQATLVLCDVTEREQLARLQEENERREQFLALLAHELKNPLAPISNAAELIRQLSPDRKVQRAAEVILRQAQHQARLVEDLLDAARVREGKVTLRLRRLDLRGALREAADATEEARRAKQIRLQVDMPPEPVCARADATRITQLVVNLLANAAKFTGEGGENRLTLEAGHDVAWIRVQDTGVGIDPSLLPHVFEPYAQAACPQAPGNSGLGLGLALVRSLARMHGGGVRAASDGPGKGAEFTVWLPLAEPGATSAADAD
jgi:signal transduction histidine kinase